MLDVLSDLINELFAPLNESFQSAFEVIVAFCLQNPLEGGFFGGAFAWANTVTLYLQALALGIFIIMKVVVGIKDGIFSEGGDPTTGESAGQWLFRSLKGLIIICAMPSLMRWTAGFSMAVAADIASNGADTVFSTFIQNTMVNTALALGGGPVAVLWSLLVAIIMLYYICVIFFQLIKRQLQLIALSLIAPLVAITSGTRDTSDLGTLMKEAVSLGIVSGLQLLMVLTAMAFGPASFISLDIEQTLSLSNIVLLKIAPFIQIAIFSGIKKFPDWIERFTSVVSVSGNSGRVAAGGAAYAARSLLVRAAR